MESPIKQNTLAVSILPNAELNVCPLPPSCSPQKILCEYLVKCQYLIKDNVVCDVGVHITLSEKRVCCEGDGAGGAW